jgi:hypothetical protein
MSGLDLTVEQFDRGVEAFRIAQLGQVEQKLRPFLARRPVVARKAASSCRCSAARRRGRLRRARSPDRRAAGSSEILRVECARACDDKLATRDGPFLLYSAPRLRGWLGHARDRSYFNDHPRYNSADRDRCPRCRQSLVRDLYPTCQRKLHLCDAQVWGLTGGTWSNPPRQYRGGY